MAVTGTISRRAFRPFFLAGLATLLSAVACAGSSAPTSGAPTEIKVTMADFSYAAPVTTFKVGVPYRFVVTNSGKVNHEFMVVSPPTTGESSEDLDKSALGRIDDSTFPPGSTQTLDVTFTKAQTSGVLEFACHVSGHYEQGMRLPITVTQ
jgi:uncharacterized cupredoxin-like copper-binding protein